MGDTGTRRSLRSSKVGRKAGSTGLSRKFPKQPVGGSVPREEVGGRESSESPASEPGALCIAGWRLRTGPGSQMASGAIPSQLKIQKPTLIFQSPNVGITINVHKSVERSYRFEL